MPEQYYKEVDEKVRLLVELRDKYLSDEELKDQKKEDEWEKYEQEENDTKWQFYVNRSLQPTIEIAKWIQNHISFYGFILQADEISMMKIKMGKFKYQLRYEYRLNQE